MTAPASTPDPAFLLPPAAQRVAVLALALAAFALNLNTNVLGALLPFLRDGLGLGADAGKVLVAAAAAGSAVGALLAAPAGGRFGRRAVLLAGLAVFVVASALHPFAGGYAALVALRALAGAAVGAAYAAASALCADLAPYARRGAVLGWFNAGLFLAIPLGMPLAVATASAGHWAAIFGVQAAVGALGAWFAWRAVPQRPVPPTGGFGLHLLGRAPVAAALLATMLHVGSFFTTVQLATTWLDASGRLAKEQQLPVWIGLGLLSAVGSLLFGRLSDRLGKRRFVLGTSLLLVACFAALALAPQPLVLVAGGGLLAVVAAARTGPLQALLSGLVPPEQLGAVMALRGSLMQAGVVGFALAAAPIEAGLGFAGVLWLGAACQLASFGAIAWAVREGR